MTNSIEFMKSMNIRNVCMLIATSHSKDLLSEMFCFHN
jgi:hypothetical protein